MLITRTLFAVASVGVLAGCSSAGAPQAPSADISKIAGVTSSFGPEFKVTDVPKTGIDPKLLASQKLPDGLIFDPADCAKFAAGQAMPPDLKGNLAAASAEGAGNRFIAIAMETSESIPVVEPGNGCQHVGFTGGALRGAVDVVPAPQIDGVQTQGVHRILETTINDKPQTGEIYSYLAHFGTYQVIVTANPLVIPDQPVVPVDTKRAEALLSAAVAAIRS